jgi:hypothetical protein
MARSDSVRRRGGRSQSHGRERKEARVIAVGRNRGKVERASYELRGVVWLVQRCQEGRPIGSVGVEGRVRPPDRGRQTRLRFGLGLGHGSVSRLSSEKTGFRRTSPHEV